MNQKQGRKLYVCTMCGDISEELATTDQRVSHVAEVHGVNSGYAAKELAMRMFWEAHE